MLAPDELEALDRASSTTQTKAQPRAIPFTVGRGDHDITRGLSNLDMQVPALRRRLRDRLRHQTKQVVDVDDTSPLAMPIDELFSRNSNAVIAEMSGAVGQPPGFLVFSDSTARALALAALQVRTRDVVDSGNSGRSTITSGELRLLSRLVSVLVEDVADVLPKTAPGQPIRMVRLLTDARVLGPPQGILLCLSFNLTGDVDARIDLGIPSSWLVRAPRAPEKKGTPRRIGDEPSNLMLAISAELGRTPMTLRRLLALVPGDVIHLLASPTAPVPVLVQGKPKLLARPELRGGRVSLSIAVASDDHRGGSEEGTPIVEASSATGGSDGRR